MVQQVIGSSGWVTSVFVVKTQIVCVTGAYNRHVIIAPWGLWCRALRFFMFVCLLFVVVVCCRHAF